MPYLAKYLDEPGNSVEWDHEWGAETNRALCNNMMGSVAMGEKMWEMRKWGKAGLCQEARNWGEVTSEECPAAEGLGGRALYTVSAKPLALGTVCMTTYSPWDWILGKVSKVDSVSPEIDSERRKRDWRMVQKRSLWNDHKREWLWGRHGSTRLSSGGSGALTTYT